MNRELVQIRLKESNDIKLIEWRKSSLLSPSAANTTAINSNAKNNNNFILTSKNLSAASNSPIYCKILICFNKKNVYTDSYFYAFGESILHAIAFYNEEAK